MAGELRVCFKRVLARRGCHHEFSDTSDGSQRTMSLRGTAYYLRGSDKTSRSGRWVQFRSCSVLPVCLELRRERHVPLRHGLDRGSFATKVYGASSGTGSSRRIIRR